MKKHLFLSALAIALFAVFAAPPVFPQEAGPTPKDPLVINMKNRSVSVLAQVNGKYLVQPTRHGVVFKGGSNGSKSVFAALVEPKPFYEALIKIGSKPGNNMTWENKEKTCVQGDQLDVFVTWAGAKKAYRLDEVIRDSNGKPLVIRFGGNLQAAMDKKTGCLLCLDSCPVGITSNATYTYGAIESRKETSLMGNKDILPPDGTLVVITFKAKG
jgi:ferredoxin